MHVSTNLNHDADTIVCFVDFGNLKRIIATTPVPVVPMALRGLWGSFFSRKDGAALSKTLRLRPFKRIGLAAGVALPAVQMTPEKLQAQVLALRGDWQ